MQDQRNLMLAIVLSVAILLGFQMLFVPPPPPPDPSATSEQVAGEAVDTPSVPGTPSEAASTTWGKDLMVSPPARRDSERSDGRPES